MANITIPTAIIGENIYSTKVEELYRIGTTATEFLTELCTYIKKTRLPEYIVEFDLDIGQKEQLQWLETTKNLLNAHLRRDTEYYGLGSGQRVSHNQISLPLLNKNNLNYISTDFESLAVKAVYNSFINKCCFVEIVIDPAEISYDQLQHFLKQSKSFNQLLSQKFQQEVFTLRKTNAGSQFSFTIVYFTQQDVESAINGEPKPGDLVFQPEFNEKECLEESRMFLISLLFDKNYLNLAKHVLHQINQYAQTIQIPPEIQFLDSYVSFFSQIMSIEFISLREQRLVAHQRIGRHVTQLKLVQADQQYCEQISVLRKYVFDQIPLRFRAIAEGIYDRGNGKPQKENQKEMKNDEENSDNKEEKEVGNEGQLVVDEALQQYLFGTGNILNLELKDYDQDMVTKNIVAIQREIQKQLLGNDTVKCGITLDGSPYIQIIKE